MEKWTAFLAIVAVILYGIHREHSRTHSDPHNPVADRNTSTSPRINQPVSHTEYVPYTHASVTPADTPQYIRHVIRYGSHTLHVKKNEIMEGGLASPEDAVRIAAYVLQLRHDPVDPATIQNGALFYSSNCAGCHGNDGRGLGGAYPDLTRHPLLGIARYRAQQPGPVSRP